MVVAYGQNTYRSCFRSRNATARLHRRVLPWADWKRKSCGGQRNQKQAPTHHPKRIAIAIFLQPRFWQLFGQGMSQLPQQRLSMRGAPPVSTRDYSGAAAASREPIRGGRQINRACEVPCRLLAHSWPTPPVRQPTEDFVGTAAFNSPVDRFGYNAGLFGILRQATGSRLERQRKRFVRWIPSELMTSPNATRNAHRLSSCGT